MDVIEKNEQTVTVRMTQEQFMQLRKISGNLMQEYPILKAPDVSRKDIVNINDGLYDLFDIVLADRRARAAADGAEKV
ncbi:MAG: hypothetical protein PW788_11105 [Micavibrio sp.]|nr:hypothetical protein [Micavibrio sp.]